MKIIFLAGDQFALTPLKRLQNLGWIKQVVTRREKSQGRGRKVLPTAVGVEAQRLHLPLLEVENLNDLSETEITDIDLLVCVAFGLKIPSRLINRFSLGEINLHPSLLPEYRGAAPIRRALWEGKVKTGVTIHRVSLTYDRGDIYQQQEVPIYPDDNYTTLSERLASIGTDLLVDTIQKIRENQILTYPQEHEKATYAPRLHKSARIINWAWDSVSIVNQIRALSLTPGAITFFENEEWKLFSARVCTEVKAIDLANQSQTMNKPGCFINKLQKLLVKTADGWVEILSLQRPGKKILPVVDFVRGVRIKEGCFKSE